MPGRNGRYSQSLGSPSASKLPCFALVRNDRHAIAGYPNEAALGVCESRTKMPTLADATSTQAPFPMLRRAFRQLSRLSPAASLDTINPQPYHRPEFLTVVSMRSFFVKTQPSANAPSILCFSALPRFMSRSSLLYVFDRLTWRQSYITQAFEDLHVPINIS